MDSSMCSIAGAQLLKHLPVTALKSRPTGWGPRFELALLGTSNFVAPAAHATCALKTLGMRPSNSRAPTISRWLVPSESGVDDNILTADHFKRAGQLWGSAGACVCA